MARRCRGDRNALRLNIEQADRQFGAFRRQMQPAFAAVGDWAFLQNITFVDKLLEDARQTLLGDAQEVQQIGDAEPRVPIDEMQNTVVGASETDLVQDCIRFTRKIAIGKKEQLHHLDKSVRRRAAGRRPAITRDHG